MGVNGFFGTNTLITFIVSIVTIIIKLPYLYGQGTHWILKTVVLDGLIIQFHNKILDVTVLIVRVDNSNEGLDSRIIDIIYKCLSADATQVWALGRVGATPQHGNYSLHVFCFHFKSRNGPKPAT